MEKLQMNFEEKKMKKEKIFCSFSTLLFVHCEKNSFEKKNSSNFEKKNLREQYEKKEIGIYLLST